MISNDFFLDFVQPAPLLRMYVEAYETLSNESKFFFYNMQCFVMFVTAVCILFLNGIRNHDLCDSGAGDLPTELLSRQLGAGHLGSVYARE